MDSISRPELCTQIGETLTSDSQGWLLRLHGRVVRRLDGRVLGSGSVDKGWVRFCVVRDATCPLG